MLSDYANQYNCKCLYHFVFTNLRKSNIKLEQKIVRSFLMFSIFIRAHYLSLHCNNNTVWSVCCIVKPNLQLMVKEHKVGGLMWGSRNPDEEDKLGGCQWESFTTTYHSNLVQFVHEVREESSDTLVYQHLQVTSGLHIGHVKTELVLDLL